MEDLLKFILLPLHRLDVLRVQVQVKVLRLRIDVHRVRVKVKSLSEGDVKLTYYEFVFKYFKFKLS